MTKTKNRIYIITIGLLLMTSCGEKQEERNSIDFDLAIVLNDLNLTIEETSSKIESILERDALIDRYNANGINEFSEKEKIQLIKMPRRVWNTTMYNTGFTRLMSKESIPPKYDGVLKSLGAFYNDYEQALTEVDLIMRNLTLRIDEQLALKYSWYSELYETKQLSADANNFLENSFEFKNLINNYLHRERYQLKVYIQMRLDAIKTYDLVNGMIKNKNTADFKLSEEERILFTGNFTRNNGDTIQLTSRDKNLSVVGLSPYYDDYKILSPINKTTVIADKSSWLVQSKKDGTRIQEYYIFYFNHHVETLKRIE